MAPRNFSIGELSRQSGVKITTIRHYEHIGLMPKPPRTSSERRLYDTQHARRLNFIRHARDLGFNLEEIRALFRLADSPELSCAHVSAIAKQRLRAVEDKLALLKRLRAELSRMIVQCSGGRVAQCRIIETLSDRSLLRKGNHADDPNAFNTNTKFE